ncbi:MAG: hypothetical protein JXO22_16965 [Phycisphaerae bacterium]|nr:hypothetical protein [Phycisphaerae bacterium]
MSKTNDIPEFCDYDCPHADFPPAETAGICRTMSGVWCKKLKELVNKNVACEWRRRGAGRKPTKSVPQRSSSGRTPSRRKR